MNTIQWWVLITLIIGFIFSIIFFAHGVSAVAIKRPESIFPTWTIVFGGFVTFFMLVSYVFMSLYLIGFIK